MRRLYFGHPVNTYNTIWECSSIIAIFSRFADVEVENPNRRIHEVGYQRSKANLGSGMSYFYAEVLPKCDGGVFLPFRDGAWGAGVAGEMRFFLEEGKRIWSIDFRGVIADIPPDFHVEPLSVEETRRRIALPY